eukprot:Hpha_TRINITY_DN14519_c0_g2::TRINITY_DN14519_c0_g2_i1::g.47220::m.47220
MEDTLLLLIMILATATGCTLFLIPVRSWAKKRSSRRRKLLQRDIPNTLWVCSGEVSVRGLYRLHHPLPFNGCTCCELADDIESDPVWISANFWLVKGEDGCWYFINRDATKSTMYLLPVYPFNPDTVWVKGDYPSDVPHRCNKWHARTRSVPELSHAPRTRITLGTVGFDWEEPHPGAEVLAENMHGGLPDGFNKMIGASIRIEESMRLDGPPDAGGPAGDLQTEVIQQEIEVVDRFRKMAGIGLGCNGYDHDVSNSQAKKAWMDQRANVCIESLNDVFQKLENQLRVWKSKERRESQEIGLMHTPHTAAAADLRPPLFPHLTPADVRASQLSDPMVDSSHLSQISLVETGAETGRETSGTTQSAEVADMEDYPQSSDGDDLFSGASIPEQIPPEAVAAAMHAYAASPKREDPKLKSGFVQMEAPGPATATTNPLKTNPVWGGFEADRSGSEGRLGNMQAASDDSQSTASEETTMIEGFSVSYGGSQSTGAVSRSVSFA